MTLLVVFLYLSSISLHKKLREHGFDTFILGFYLLRYKSNSVVHGMCETKMMMHFALFLLKFLFFFHKQEVPSVIILII